MADNTNMEREYVIPLRRHILKVPAYRRSAKAIKAIKAFVAKHMKVAERDVDKVKLDVYFNNEVWLRGKTNPPNKVKVKATKEGDIVKVTFVQMPERVKFQKAKNERLHQEAPKQAQTPAAAPKAEEKTADEKIAEKEKEASVAEAAQKQAKADAKAQKHVTKPETAKQPQRMALQK